MPIILLSRLAGIVGPGKTDLPISDAAEVEGINFDDNYAADDKAMRLTGAGLLRYWGFKAYTGALYLEEGASVDDVLADKAKRIELEYLRAFKGKDFGPATDKSIAKHPG